MDLSLKTKPDRDHYSVSRQCSGLAYRHAKSTFSERASALGQPLPNLDGGFANIVRLHNQAIGITSDGIGTKVEVAERMGRYDSLGFDLVAMVVDDLVAMGINPTNLSNILDVDRLCPTTIDSLMGGLAEAAKNAGVAVTGGEIAELGPRITGFGSGMHFNWCATAIGVLEEGRTPITGQAIQLGDQILAFEETGFRSNGFTAARRILEKAFGPSWHERMHRELKKPYGELLLTPSRIYAPLVRALLEKNMIPHGISHITGGGIPANLGRILKRVDLSAELFSLLPPPEIMEELIHLGGLDLASAFQHWNMGNGLLMVVDPSDVAAVFAEAKAFSYPVKLAGQITSGPVRVQISYKGQTHVFANPGK